MRGAPSTPSIAPWPTVRLGDLALGPAAFADGPFGSNLKTDTYSDSGARVIRLGNIGRGEFLPDDAAYIPFEHFNRLSRHHAVAGDVVVAALGDGVRPAGRACLVPPDLGPALVKADCFRVRLPSTRIDPGYLVLYLNSPPALDAVSRAMRGATRPRVNLSILKDTRVPLPSLPEQKRIAAALREQLDAAARMRSSADAQRDAADGLFSSALHCAFGQDLPPSCHKASLRTVVKKVGSGSTPRGGQAAYQEMGVPFIRSQNVHMNRFERDGLVSISLGQDEQMSNTRVLPGDILLNITGASIGRVCTVPDDICPANVNQHVSTIRCDRSIDPRFLCYFMSSPGFQSWMLDTQAGATRQALTKAQILDFVVPILSREEQNAIADKLDALHRSAEAVRSVLVHQAAEISRLPAALLRQAFSGGL